MQFFFIELPRLLQMTFESQNAEYLGVSTSLFVRYHFFAIFDEWLLFSGSAFSFFLGAQMVDNPTNSTSLKLHPLDQGNENFTNISNMRCYDQM